jgi:hypothetical protein
MALQPLAGPWPLFQFVDPIYTRQDSLDGGNIYKRILDIYAYEFGISKITWTPVYRKLVLLPLLVRLTVFTLTKILVL